MLKQYNETLSVEASEVAMTANGISPQGTKNEAHDHQRCIDDALTAAERVCKERGARLTPLRRRVLELVWESHRPAAAYALLDALKPDHSAAAPPTIYRALDFLLENGLVHRVQTLNAFVGCDAPEHAHRGFFVICEDCGDAAELEDPALDSAVTETAAKQGFTVHARTLEATGLCHHCQSA